MNNDCKRMTAVLAVAVALIFAGCGKKAPDEANAALSASLNALAQMQAVNFIGVVLPAQQRGVTSLPQWPFFQAVKGFKIDNEFDTGVTDSTAGIMVSLYFDDEQKNFSTIKFYMKKEGARWYVDLNETITRQIASNGAQAFQVWKFVIKK